METQGGIYKNAEQINDSGGQLVMKNQGGIYLANDDEATGKVKLRHCRLCVDMT